MKKTYSLTGRIALILVLNLVLSFVFLSFMTYFTRARLREEIAVTSGVALGMQASSLDQMLKSNRHFLANIFSADDSCQTLRQHPEKRLNLQYAYSIHQKFVAYQLEDELGEMLFLCVGQRVYPAFANKGRFDTAQKIAAERYLKERDWLGEDSRILREFVTVDGEIYYLLAFHDGEIRLGEMVKLSSLLEKISMRLDGGQKLTIYGDDTGFMAEQDWARREEIDVRGLADVPYGYTGRKGNYLAIPANMEYLPGMLVYLMPEGTALGNLQRVAFVMDCFYGVVLTLTCVCFLAFWRTLRAPLSRLKKTIIRIREGDMSQKISYTKTSREMGEVYSLFNQMMDRINGLKIDAYEEKLKNMDLQMQYFKLQVKPHFYLNSLKCLYAMAENRDYGKIQKMILNLSEYFKSMTYDKQSMTTVSKELEHVSTYLQIRQAGMESTVDCQLSLDSRARKCLVPVLCIQTFVENSFKYGLVDGRPLQIRVEIGVRQEAEGMFLRILVRDNGSGYPPEILRALGGDGAEIIQGHIGLTNLWNRLHIIYRGQASLTIENAPEGGACSEMRIPMESPNMREIAP